jgi:PAS domain S-box-containing protein
LIILTLDGNIRFANSEIGKILGADPPSLLGKDFKDYLSRGGAIFFETQFAPSLLLRRSLEEISLELRRLDGQTEPVLVNAVIRKTQGPSASEAVLAIFRARQRRLYETELLRARRDSEQISEIVRRSSDAIIRFTANAAIENWNNGAQHIFGQEISQWRGKSLDCLFAPEAHLELADALTRLRRGEDVVLETKGLRSSGDPLDVSVSLTPHMEAPGVLVAFSAIIRDTTDRRRAERALIQSEKLASVGRLASSIAHEINNPLEAVTNLLFILASRVQEPESKEILTLAQDELGRVSHIATHALRFHKQSTRRTEVNLGAVIDSVLALFRARLVNSNIRTTVDCPDGLALACFEGEIRQVLVNLIGNAFDAMRSGGELRLRVRERRSPSGDPRIRIIIADTGSGISSQVREHLFEPFFSTKGIGGTGLGLWITKDLVLKNGGTIHIRSSAAPGNSGTVVLLQFPA